MIIANPLYDVAFKKMMENNRVARFLLGTILKCEIVSLNQSATEYTIDIDDMPELDTNMPNYTLTRMDYAAVIRTKEGEENEVLIEVQKTLNIGDIMRFRRYLAVKYKHSQLPLITIYILGFNLDVESPAFYARPDCHDLLTDELIPTNDIFVKGLTHTTYFIQTLRIKASEQTLLQRMLSVFEQRNFINGGHYNKAFKYTPSEPELKEMVNILQSVAGDEDLQAALEKEEYKMQWLDDLFGTSYRKEAELLRAINDKDKALEDKDHTIAENEKALEDAVNKLKAIARKQKQQGVPLQQIAQMTGLDITEIESL